MSAISIDQLRNKKWAYRKSEKRKADVKLGLICIHLV